MTAIFTVKTFCKALVRVSSLDETKHCDECVCNYEFM